MKIIKTFRGKKNETIDSINQWLQGENVEIISEQEFNIGDGYTQSYAVCNITGNYCNITTALSGFQYLLKIVNKDDIEIEYEGAWNGLGRQEILPLSLKELKWGGARVNTTLKDEEITYEEYKKIREDERKIREMLHETYGDQNKSGFKEGLQCNKEELDEVFEKFDNWSYYIQVLDYDPVHQWDSTKYNWSKIVFVHEGNETPFFMYKKEMK